MADNDAQVSDFLPATSLLHNTPPLHGSTFMPDWRTLTSKICFYLCYITIPYDTISLGSVWLRDCMLKRELACVYFYSISESWGLTWRQRFPTTAWAAYVRERRRWRLDHVSDAVLGSAQERFRRDQESPLQDCGNVHVQDWQAWSRKGASGRVGYLHRQEAGGSLSINP